MSFKNFLEESVGKFEKDYHQPLKPSQKAAIERRLLATIKMYLMDGYDVLLRTTPDDDRGLAVLLYIKKGNELSRLVSHASMGPNGKMKDIL